MLSALPVPVRTSEEVVPVIDAIVKSPLARRANRVDSRLHEINLTREDPVKSKTLGSPALRDKRPGASKVYLIIDTPLHRALAWRNTLIGRGPRQLSASYLIGVSSLPVAN